MAEAMNKGQQIKDAVLQLQDLLLRCHPQMPTLLQQIHTAIRQDEDLAHLLTPEERGIIVRGLKTHKNIVIATATVKSKGGKSMKNITVEDL